MGDTRDPEFMASQSFCTVMSFPPHELVDLLGNVAFRYILCTTNRGKTCNNFFTPPQSPITTWGALVAGGLQPPPMPWRRRERERERERERATRRWMEAGWHDDDGGMCSLGHWPVLTIRLLGMAPQRPRPMSHTVFTRLPVLLDSFIRSRSHQI